MVRTRPLFRSVGIAQPAEGTKTFKGHDLAELGGALWAHFDETGPRTPVLVDDKMYTYAIVGVSWDPKEKPLIDHGQVLVFDPHVRRRTTLVVDHWQAIHQLGELRREGKQTCDQRALGADKAGDDDTTAARRGARWRPIRDFFGGKTWMVFLPSRQASQPAAAAAAAVAAVARAC